MDHPQTQSHHRFLCVFVVGVPADAHHHLVDVSIVHLCPAIVDPCEDVSRETVHHRLWEVCCGKDEQRW